jgi:hypothetical protein
MSDVPLPETFLVLSRLQSGTEEVCRLDEAVAYAAAVSAAENARLREALQAVQTAMHKAWAEGRLTSPPWTPELAAQVNEALKGQP